MGCTAQLLDGGSARQQGAYRGEGAAPTGVRSLSQDSWERRLAAMLPGKSRGAPVFSAVTPPGNQDNKKPRTLSPPGLFRFR
jgi:hypothetical protein